jgi:hypothetical protein
LLSSARIGAVVALCLGPLLWGCSHDYGTLGGGAGGTGECPVGNETCACFPNMTCQTGLTCASNLCVRVGGTGTGGSPGAGGSIGPGGSLGAGGMGPGGSVGSGGSVGPGGSRGSGGGIGPGGSVGSGGGGGAVGAGGTVGTGGSAVIGSGGSVGSGGAAGTGGPSPPANNQIVNGDFNSGSSVPWHITESTDATSAVTNGQFCVTEPTSYTGFNVGWPTTSSPVAVLQASTTYELYYQISTTAPLYSFSVKVGSAPGSTANLTDLMTTGSQGEPTAGAGLQTFSFTFVPGADPTAGIVFLLYSGATATTVCIDNVALGTPN